MRDWKSADKPYAAKEAIRTIAIGVFVTVCVTWRLHGMVEAKRAACPTRPAAQGPTNTTPGAQPTAAANTCENRSANLLQE